MARSKDKQGRNGEETAVTNAQLKKIAQVASQVAINEYRKERTKDEATFKDKRLYNTRLLLERYRGLVKYCEGAVYEASQVDEDAELQSLVEVMTSLNENATLSALSIKEQVCKVRIIIDHVTKMLDYYRSSCHSSGKQDMQRRWDTICGLYLQDERMDVDQLAVKFSVDERTVYRYANNAMQDLSTLLFGILE